jgi:hypothetical protein
MEYMSLLELVMHPLVPLMKHTASIKVKIVAAARLPVACRMSSEMGMLLDVDKTVPGSVMQNNITMMNITPLNYLSQHI